MAKKGVKVLGQLVRDENGDVVDIALHGPDCPVFQLAEQLQDAGADMGSQEVQEHLTTAHDATHKGGRQRRQWGGIGSGKWGQQPN